MSLEILISRVRKRTSSHESSIQRETILIFQSPLCWTKRIQDEENYKRRNIIQLRLDGSSPENQTENHHSKEDHLGVLKPFEMNKKRDCLNFGVPEESSCSLGLGDPHPSEETP